MSHARSSTSRRDRRRALRAATRRRVRGGENLAPRPVQRFARQVDDAAYVASNRVRRLLVGDRPFQLGIVALLVLGVLVLSGPLQTYLEQGDRVDLLQQQVAALDEANGELQQRADDLRRPEYQQLLARERYGYVNPGEVAYVVVPPERDPSEIGDRVEVDEPAPQPWFREVWDGMKGLFG